MPKLFEVIRHPKEMQEFGQYAKAILPVMTDPDIQREKKREMLNEFVNNLTDKTFHLDIIAEQIIEIIDIGQKSSDICKEYENTEEQVRGILDWLPRMAYHKDKLYREVRKHRKEYGLEL